MPEGYNGNLTPKWENYHPVHRCQPQGYKYFNISYFEEAFTITT